MPILGGNRDWIEVALDQELQFRSVDREYYGEVTGIPATSPLPLAKDPVEWKLVGWRWPSRSVIPGGLLVPRGVFHLSRKANGVFV